jgi:predicted nuclease of predicted toxin-antitoxin system
MKLIADAHIGRLITNWLVGQGHDVLRVATLPPAITDEEILRLAADQRRVVLTADKDFGELVFRVGQPSTGVILLRIDVPTERERLNVIVRLWPRIEPLTPDHFVVVTSRGIRRTPLP